MDGIRHLGRPTIGRMRSTDRISIEDVRCDVAGAHRQAVCIERAVQAALPGTEVVVHIEPIEERASWEDSELLAIEQARKDG